MVKDNLDNFEYYFLKDGKYQIGVFKEKTYDKDWKLSYMEGRFNDFKFKYYKTLLNSLRYQKIDGYPSNTGINGWVHDHKMYINGLTVKWHTNFSYEDSKPGFSPYVEILFKKILLKKIENIESTKEFVELINNLLDSNEVIKLIEEEFGIDKCFEILKKNIASIEILKIYIK